MISFSNINKQYGKQLIFVDASFQLNPGEKVGLVGPNGAGKTTLFRMVVGEETPDEGSVSVPKKLTIGYFRQDVEEMQGRGKYPFNQLLHSFEVHYPIRFPRFSTIG
jgi:ATPase subunit of ABC transporter with duplicated ATPase domains